MPLIVRGEAAVQFINGCLHLVETGGVFAAPRAEQIQRLAKKHYTRRRLLAWRRADPDRARRQRRQGRAKPLIPRPAMHYGATIFISDAGAKRFRGLQS